MVQCKFINCCLFLPVIYILLRRFFNGLVKHFGEYIFVWKFYLLLHKSLDKMNFMFTKFHINLLVLVVNLLEFPPLLEKFYILS